MSEQVESDETIAALRQEVAQLQRAVFSHAIVDQAIGVVVAYGGVRPGTAWEVLKEISQHTNTKLREVAELVVRWPHEGWLPEDVRGALTAAVARANPRDRAGQPTGS